MEEQKDYFSPDLMSLEQQEGKDTYYIPKLQQTIDAGEYASERDIEIAAVKRMAGKNNNAFVRGMRNLEEPLSYAMFDGYLEKKLKEYGMEQESSGWAATKGAVKGVLSAPARFAGYAATNTLPLIAKTATSLYAISGAAGGVESAEKFIREANKGIEAWSKEIQRLTGIDDASAVENIVGNAIGSVWGSVAIAGAVGGGAVAPMFGVSAAQDTYTRQREAGKSIGESALRGVWHGTGEAALESLQFNRIFGNLAKKSKPIAMLKDLLENAVQEGIQQANEQAANWNIDNRSLVEKLQEIGASVIGGAIASLGGSVGGNILNRNTINEVGDLMKKTGHSDEEIQTVKENLNKIVDTDELEQAANMVAKDELTTIALTYKEQAQAVSDELVNQLDSAISRNELVEVPGELSSEKPTDMPPLYQLGDMQVDTQKNPALGMVLYQADKEGKPFETLGQVLEWTQGKLDVAKAKELSTGVNSVYTQTYEQLKGLGQDERLADSNARVRSAMAFSIANTYGVSVEQANKMLGGIVSQKFSEFEGVAPQEVQDAVTEKVEQNVEHRSEMSQQELEETPIEQTQDVPSSEAIIVFDDGTTTSYKPQTLFQSAYAGSRVDYERPSLEAMGSGEGHQSHGWGLYYALNKDVAEGYRKRFSDEEIIHRGKRIINDNPEDAGSDYWVFYNIKTKGKNNAIDYYKDAINTFKTAIKKFPNEKEYISKDLKSYENGLKRILSLSKEDIDELVKERGQVHEVDIPESPYLLDEQKMLIDQSDYVQERVQQANKELNLGIKDSGITGDRIYNKISDKLGSDKQASQYLEKLGIKGITYFGRQDGRCFVIFNPDDVKVIQKFYQGEPGTARGAYYNNVTYLFENANESTFVHEQAHAYMDVLQNLANNGNQQAQRDLNAIRNWLGKKQGDELTQPDWERFARGFEMYVREGKAPNQYLGGKDGVFERFKNWLMNIYAGIKSLTVRNEQGKEEPVRINKQIKDFYDEMLGGEDIDSIIDNAQKNEQALAMLQNKLKEFSDLQQRLAEERSKLVRDMANNVKPDTTWANVKDWGNNLWESARDLPTNVLKSSYARLAAIDKKLGLLVQRAEQSQGLRIKRWTDQIKPFYEAFNDLSAEDKAKVQFYLLNQQWGEVEGLLGQENTNAVHNMLKTIYDELIASGVEVGYRENYFPRSVLDYDGLLQEMGLTYPALRKEMEQAIGKDASPEEQAEWLDKHIMGFKGNVSTKGNKYTKERKLDLITDKMAQYYKPSMETLVNYVEGMAKLLSMREAFGKDIEYKGSEESAKDSIGKIIDRMFGDNKLTKKEIDEVRDVLSSLYLPNGMGNKFLQAMRQYGYATKLSYSTTIRQFADIGMMMKVNGVLNTLDALFHPDKRITLENLGIDPLGEEFQTSKKDIGGKIANFSTKWKGINWADAIMKNAFMRGNYKDLQKLAKTPDKFHEKYDALFGDETDTLIKDLNNDKVSEPVKVLLFHEISKIQPISRSAMPTAYLSNPNGRVFYMFKTFSLHRAEYMVSELANDFRTGDLKKAGKDIMADVAVIGWEGLVELLISFLKYGWQAFAAQEVLDTFAGAGLGVLGLNKHQALQITRGQVGDFFQEMVGVGTPFDDIGYMIRHADETDKLLRAFLPDLIIEPLLAGPKPISNKKKKNK